MSKLTRVNLQELAHVRLTEAHLLLDGRSFAGAYYLTGLALECALKACIARSSEQYDFPELKRVQDNWHHDLTVSMKNMLKKVKMTRNLKQIGER